jgi:DNA adenine methylase
VDNVKPFLRWAGSKRKLLPRLRAYWQPHHKRYIEPFAGSAALFFEINPQKALLGDINADLVDMYHCVCRHPLAIHRALTRLRVGKRAYYQIRSQDPASLCPVARAARFIYLNRYCFNGLYRTNEQGAFNVPHSGSRTGCLPSLSELRGVAKTLKRAKIIHADFQTTVGLVRPGDFVYLDPPFAVSNRRVFRQYGPSSFGLDDLQRLAEALVEIDSRNATFLVSYAMCREALQAFKKWHVRRAFTLRSVAGFSPYRRKAVEILVTNDEPCCDK